MWNVEGLGKGQSSKLLQIQQHMHHFGIAVLCIQETHLAGTTHFLSNDYLVVLSGGTEVKGKREYAGVGFIISPWARRAVIGFTLHSNRLASLQLRVAGGVMTFLSVYAPHGGYAYTTRRNFYDNFISFFRSQRTYGPTLSLGDYNARLHKALPGEEDVIGQGAFGNASALSDPRSNRELLVESCRALNTVVANTFCESLPEAQVTFYSVGAKPMDDIVPSKFAQLDHVLVSKPCANFVQECRSHRTAALQSRHFLVTVDVQLEIEVKPRPPDETRWDLSHFKDTEVTSLFASRFANSMQDTVLASSEAAAAQQEKVNCTAASVTETLKVCASSLLRRRAVVAQKPWISGDTLALIELRNSARLSGNFAEEGSCNRRIKLSAKKDRSTWLDAMVSSGDWQQIKKFRKGFVPRQGGLRSKAGQSIRSDMRAETLAEYLEQVQWQVKFADVHPTQSDILGPTLAIQLGKITCAEMKTAMVRMKGQRAAGDDGVPPEFWKALLDNVDAMMKLRDFLQDCWENKVLPDQWRQASVVALFKKGDPRLPSNYRPISLLSVGYKVLASILLDRLKAGGAEDRMRNSQFGFRPGRSTSDALYLTRRVVDAALLGKGPGIMMLLLDWAKAFDRLRKDSMLDALRRFGVPGEMLHMINAIYSDRTFSVRDGATTSTSRRQLSGILQGCPLSPYLFIMVQSVMLHDVSVKLHRDMPDTSEPAYAVTRDVLYADDTLLMSADAVILQTHLNLIVSEGQAYGLELNWDKTVAININNNGSIHGPHGQILKSVQQAVYLGGLIAASGAASPEVTRRLGEARGSFEQLQTVWKHANLTRERKLEIYHACVIPKLLYALESLCLLKADRQKLDCFHFRCLRRICGIAHSYTSRVTNKVVVATARAKHLSKQVLQRQLMLLHKLANQPADSYARQLTFQSDMLLPKRWVSSRSRGRPKLQWVDTVFGHALKAVGGSESQLAHFFSGEPKVWHDKVSAYCYSD
jgi:hypothetical protein